MKVGDLVRHKNLSYRYGIILSTTTYSNGKIKYHNVHWLGMPWLKTKTAVTAETYLELLSEG